MPFVGKLIIISGISGVGKSTLLNKALPLLGDKIKLVNHGDVILRLIRNKYPNIDRDELYKFFHKKEYKEAQRESAKEIAKLKENNNILLDTHLVLYVNNVFISGIDREMLAILKPDGIIVITAPITEIFERRVLDKKRHRPFVSPEQLKRWEQLVNSFTTIMAYEGIPVFFVENIHLDKAISDLVNTIEKILND